MSGSLSHREQVPSHLFSTCPPLWACEKDGGAEQEAGPDTMIDLHSVLFILQLGEEKVHFYEPSMQMENMTSTHIP